MLCSNALRPITYSHLVSSFHYITCLAIPATSNLATLQISDFGMARDLADDTYYTVQSKGGKIPVKWTALEVGFV